MSDAAPLLHQDAITQARAIATGRVTGAGLVAAQLAEIERRNPEINAFVQRIESPAPATGSNAASLLAGACFAVKDTIDVAGMPSHAGLRALDAGPAVRTATCAARLESAGMVLVGKLNMHPVALGATNHNADFGNCYHPLRTGYTPGGSSGGSGAAVAAGLCAIALGTDTMGSVRIPAAYCGVVGFKPGFDEIPLDGIVPLSRLLDHVGILARSVADVTAAFAVMADPGGARPADGIADPLQTLTFAVPSHRETLAMSDEVRQAYEAAIARIAQAGFVLREIDVSSYDFARVRRAGLLLCEAELLGSLAQPLALRPQTLPDDLRALLLFAAGKSAADVARALATAVSAGAWLQRRLRGIDGLLLPTAGQTSFPMSDPVPHDQADFTAMANMAGAPAISLPLPVDSGQMPIGLQLIGRRGCDIALLRAAARVDAVLGAG